jgi:DNA-binding transcriptional ArsR family regulator
VDTLDRIRNEINDRLAELRPVAREYERLQQAHAVLAASGGTDDTTKRGGRGADASNTQQRRRAPRGSAREKILAAARDTPQAKRGDIAKLTGLSPNTVGSTLSKLRADGLLPRSPRSRAATSDATAEPPAATNTPVAEPPGEAPSAATGDGPQAEPEPAQTPETDQPEATSEPAEAETEPAEPAKRKPSKGRPRPAKAQSG